MKKYTVYQAKTQLSKILNSVLAGQEVLILNRNRPVAKIVPLKSGTPMSLFGSLRDKISVGKNFNDIPEGFEDYT